MARTQKDVVSYFPHDANACSGDTLTVLQSRFGNDGYAFWFKLLEKLCSTEGHVIDCSNPLKWQLLLAKMGVNEITSVEIMNLLVEMQAIDKDLWDLKLIWCQNLVDNLAEVYKNRRRDIPQKPLITGVNAIITDSNAITTDENTQSKVKYSKVNNNIVVIWNEQEIITHKQITDDTERAIKNALKYNTEEEIIQAIKNYAEILKGEQYYFKYAWTLKDFLKRGLAKFLDIELAKNNYLKDGGNGRARTDQDKPGKLPTRYTRPEELIQ